MSDTEREHPHEPGDPHEPTAGQLAQAVLEEMSGVLAATEASRLETLCTVLLRARRVFVAGEGRSGFMAKAFAMRLMHLGLHVHVVGETTTPAIGRDDTLVAVSGSGTTAGTVRVAEQALRSGAEVHAVTTAPDSPLAELAATVLLLPAATKYRRPGEAASIQPLSSLFDQATHVALDVVALRLAGRLRVDNDRAREAHSNTE